MHARFIPKSCCNFDWLQNIWHWSLSFWSFVSLETVASFSFCSCSCAVSWLTQTSLKVWAACNLPDPTFVTMYWGGRDRDNWTRRLRQTVNSVNSVNSVNQARPRPLHFVNHCFVVSISVRFAKCHKRIFLHSYRQSVLDWFPYHHRWLTNLVKVSVKTFKGDT